MLAVYDWGLKKVLKHRFVTLMASLAVLVATIFLFMVIPKGFIPNQDTNAIFGFTEGAQDISFEAMSAHQQAVAGILAKDPNVEDMMSTLSGASFATAGNTGLVFMHLKPRRERKDSADEIIPQWRPKLGEGPGMNGFPPEPPAIPTGRAAR